MLPHGVGDPLEICWRLAVLKSLPFVGSGLDLQLQALFVDLEDGEACSD